MSLGPGIPSSTLPVDSRNHAVHPSLGNGYAGGLAKLLSTLPKSLVNGGYLKQSITLHEDEVR